MKLRASGNSEAAKVLEDIACSPAIAQKYRKAYSHSLQKGKDRMLTLKALSIFVEANLSRRQYEIISDNDKKYPCYSLLQRAKKDCYPVPEAFTVTENHAEINLQDLLDHTAIRLLIYLEEIVETLSEDECNTLELISKWGCDGSQQVQYKQKFVNSEDSDGNVFQSSLVPLRLICGTENKKIIWQNPTPSSPRYCRPIRIVFTKETTDLIKDEINYIETKIASLNKTKLVKHRSLEVKHTLTMTMVDGKICNAATDTKSTMKCFICGATSKDFNDLTKTNEVNESTLRFGLSILHARIRFFESILHLSYKLPVKKWQLRTQTDKNIVKERKALLQEEFKDKMSLIVDFPKPGFGNTNDGNTSRRFFNDPKLAAEITGIDIRIITRLKIILEVISSGFQIDTEKFATYTMGTAKLYVDLYGWYPMTPTLHKILIHGPVVVKHALLPIGQLSEEAAESRNKHFRLYRLNYARKFSRKDSNMDVLNRLLLSSDPLITSMRPRPKKNTKNFNRESLDMLITESTIREDDVECSDEDMDEESNGESSVDEEWIVSPKLL